VSGLELPLAVRPPGKEVTLYDVTGTPFTGGLNETVALPLPGTAVTPVGAAGMRAELARAAPPAFVPVTVTRIELTRSDELTS
jgi:hypothetical protein